LILVVLDRPAISESLLCNKGTSRSEQFPFSFLTKDKLATKLVNEGNKLPIAFILALLAKILLRNVKPFAFLILVKLCFQRRHINIRGTFARTRFATHTQIKYFI
jgi:hypothetical protein